MADDEVNPVTPDLIPFTATRDVSASEHNAAVMTAGIACQKERTEVAVGEWQEDPMRLPASAAEAQARAQIGVGQFRSSFFSQKRSQWWDRLIAAKTPQDKLACQWMIDSFGFAFGLNEHERGAALAVQNRKLGAQIADIEAKERELRRWR